MDRYVYTAMNGASRTLEKQAVISNNMANANTPGFREQLAIHRAVPIVGDNTMDSRIGVVSLTPRNNFALGNIQSTGRELDVAVAGPGWLAVQAADGEAYTRNGGLQVGADGVLQNYRGQPVLSADNAVIEVPEGASLTFASDGTITALGAGDPPNNVMVLGQLKLVNPPEDQLLLGADGLFRMPAGEDGEAAAPLPADPLVRITSGAIEGSNVSPVEAMVGMIDNARRFEMQMKVIQHADSNAQRANALLGPGN
ncbi:flagellar basal body rod protein FlgF [Orrella sp. JC864]|uniref:flagellar basal body rod protein FlgF n=1 Tax=Orrella sp. JC864 TaxID=3120298 RepID=UPI0012BD04D7